jgi:hypothetical protein
LWMRWWTFSFRRHGVSYRKRDKIKVESYSRVKWEYEI